MVGRLNPNFKKGWHFDSSGYKVVLIPGPGRSKYEQFHRNKMEQKLGRKLNRNEVVHHKNGDKTDNRLSNLVVVSNSDHSRHHAIKGDCGVKYWRNKKASNNSD